LSQAAVEAFSLARMQIIDLSFYIQFIAVQVVYEVTFQIIQMKVYFLELPRGINRYFPAFY